MLYVPGVYCFQPDPQTGRTPTNHLRLSFGQVAPDQIEPGIQRLATVVREHLAPHKTTPRPAAASVR
jgi:DNA-binding transcriptional MocR family regulator